MLDEKTLNELKDFVPTYEDMLKKQRRGREAKRHPGLRDMIINAEPGVAVDISIIPWDEIAHENMFNRSNWLDYMHGYNKTLADRSKMARSICEKTKDSNGDALIPKGTYQIKFQTFEREGLQTKVKRLFFVKFKPEDYKEQSTTERVEDSLTKITNGQSSVSLPTDPDGRIYLPTTNANGVTNWPVGTEIHEEEHVERF